MLYTLSQARQQLKRFVDNGSCKEPVIDARINEALERLTDITDFECMRATMRITTCNNIFSLPYNVEKLLFADVNGTPAKIFGRAYQYLSSGVGDLDERSWGSGFRDIMDQGEYPVQYDVPACYIDSAGETIDARDSGLRLMAFSSAQEDEGKTLRIRGYHGSGSGEQVEASPNTQGEAVMIQQWDGGVEGEVYGYWNFGLKHSSNPYSKVTEVIKPETQGYVSLFAVAGSNSDPEKTHFTFLAKYHPRQTIPQFRRYAVTNCKDRGYSSVLALVKLRNVPLVDGDDILPVDSMQALKLMVMAISEENKGNLQGALNFEAQATAVMMKRESSRVQSDGLPVIFNADYRTSAGRHMNRHGLIL